MVKTSKSPKKDFLQSGLPFYIDILEGFLPWFKQGFRHTEKVVVFDAEGTLLSASTQSCVMHERMFEETVYPLALRKPSLCLVLFTLLDLKRLEAYAAQCSELFWLFDLIITGDHVSLQQMQRFCATGKIVGDPLLLERDRLRKPVARMFGGYPVVLVDDSVGSVWRRARPGFNGVKPRARHEDDGESGCKTLEEIDACLAVQSRHGAEIP